MGKGLDLIFYSRWCEEFGFISAFMGVMMGEGGIGAAVSGMGWRIDKLMDESYKITPFYFLLFLTLRGGGCGGVSGHVLHLPDPDIFKGGARQDASRICSAYLISAGSSARKSPKMQIQTREMIPKRYPSHFSTTRFNSTLSRSIWTWHPISSNLN